MALNFSQTYTSNSTITIPAFAQNISIYAAGAPGGDGGNDGIEVGGSFGGSGGPGRFGTFTLPTRTSSRVLILRIGRVGSNGPSDANAGQNNGAIRAPGGNGIGSGGNGGRPGQAGTGSSGGGGGGGGATGVYDNSVPAWIIVAGGGGGGGGASFPDVPGLNGNFASGWAGSGGTVGDITNGSDGVDCPTDGGGGGGGGGGASGGLGGNNGFDVETGNTRAGGGGGGRSGYLSTACTWTGVTNSHQDNGFVSVSYTVPEPIIVSFSALPTSIIIGETSTLSWNVSGNVSSVIIDIGVVVSVFASGSRTITPTSTTTYTITATGPGGTVTSQTTVTVTIPPPPTVSFFPSPTSICRGSSATLTWNVTGNVSSVSINQGIGSVATSGTRSVSPTTTTTYTITATGAGGTTTRTATLTVYQPTATNLTVDSSAIIRGQNTTLRWVTTGDATSATIDQGIGAVNINGNRNISPLETITYTVYVTGICTNSSDSVTVTVYQPPTVSITGPDSLDYGQQGTLSYEATDADISLRVTPTYNYKGSSVVGTVINLPTGVSGNGQSTTQIPYNDFGPFSVTYVIVATGNGGQESDQIIIPINVDETPTNFLVPESEDLLKDQAPIYTPDAIVTSYEIVISDIDIPVEVKSDKPILIDVNSQEDWKPIREL